MLRSRRLRYLKVVKRNCIFCKEGKDPSFRDMPTLSRFVTERGKIVGHARSGMCAKHQRKITVAVKHARHLGLLPFIVRPY